MASAAGAGRSDAYATAVASDAIEDLSKKLTVDLRKHIRALVSILAAICCSRLVVGANRASWQPAVHVVGWLTCTVVVLVVFS